MRRLAIVIGINEYPKRAEWLRGCVGDAQRFAHFLCSARGGSLASVNLMLNREATYSKILALLARAARSGTWDQVVVYFAGHGSQDGILAWDQLIPFNNLANAIKSISARRHLLVLDACMAGAVHGYFEGLDGIKVGGVDVTRVYLDLLRRASPGLRVITAVDRHTQSIEIGERGVFTTALLRAATTAAPDINEYGVSARRIFAMTRALLQKGQAPLPESSGTLGDLPLALSDALHAFGEASPKVLRTWRKPTPWGTSEWLFDFQVITRNRKFMPTTIRHMLLDRNGVAYHDNSHIITPESNNDESAVRDTISEDTLPLGRDILSIVITQDEFGRTLGQNLAAYKPSRPTSALLFR